MGINVDGPLTGVPPGHHFGFGAAEAQADSRPGRGLNRRISESKPGKTNRT